MTSTLDLMKQISGARTPQADQGDLLARMKRLQGYAPIPAPMVGPWTPERRGDVVTGIGERGRSLLAGGLRGAQRAYEALEGTVPELPAQTMADLFEKSADLIEPRTRTYRPGTSWEEVKASFKAGQIPETAWKVLKYGIETGIVSAPDMVWAIGNLPSYITARAGEILEERRSNKGGKLEAEDFGAALAAAGASGALERIGVKGFATGPVGGAVREAATEAAQEPIEYLGGRAGTEAPVDPAEMAERALAGGIAGGVYGGVAGGGQRLIERGLQGPPGVPPRVEPQGPAMPPTRSAPRETRASPAPAAAPAMSSRSRTTTLEAMQKVLRDAQKSAIALPEAQPQRASQPSPQPRSAPAPEARARPGTIAAVHAGKMPSVMIGGRRLSFDQVAKFAAEHTNDAKALSRADKLPDKPFLVFDARTSEGYEGIFPTAEAAEAFIRKSGRKFLDYGTPRSLERMNPTGPESEAFLLQDFIRVFREATGTELSPRLAPRVSPAEETTGPSTDLTEQGQQQVIPGAERIGDRELAERRMQGRQTAAVPQRPADEGLFDVAGRAQQDLLDVARRVQAAAQPPRTAAKPKVRPAQTLAEFLASRGGVQDQTGELKAMDADKWHREKPFRRRLVTDKGLAPDYAREAAEEAGFLPQGSDINDLYVALDADLRGEGRATDPTAEQVEDINRVAMEAEAEELGLTGFETMTTAQLEAELNKAQVPDWLYTFPGPLRALQKQWQVQVADPILNRLNFYPFKDLALGKLPGRAEYLTRRGLAQGQVFRVNRAVNVLATKLRKAPLQSQEAFDYLTTADADPRALPEDIRHAAVAAKSSIKKLGRELVRRGLISQEAYDKHADAYLPRVYLKFLMERTDFGSGLRVSDRGYVKHRSDLPEEYRDLYLGEIRDVPFLVTKALSQPARDLAIQDFLRDVSRNPEWVMPESVIEWTAPGMTQPRKVTPYWLKAEATALRRRAQAMPNAAHRKRAHEIASEMDATADQALGDRPGVPKDYREIPNSPRYGDLRGMVVRKEIHDDIVGQSGFWVGEKGLYEKAFDVGAKVNAIWKQMKVPFNPPTQIRNFVSNAVLLDMSGIPAERLPLLYYRAFQEIRQNGQHYRIAVRHGIPASTFTAEELYRIQPDILRVKGEKGGVAGTIARMAEPLARLAQKPGDLYQFSETLGKTVKIIDAMEREGLSEAEAVAAAQEALFDYSLVPPLVKSLRSQPIGAPFITFYYKAFPAILKGALRHPGKLVKYYLIPYLLGDALVASLNDVDEDDVEKLRMALPEWLRDQGHTYLYPYRDASGRWAFTNYGYFLPWAMHERTAHNVMDLAQGEYKGSVNDLFSEMGILGGPVPQVGAALLTGIDPFTGREIVKDTDPPKEQIYKLMMYAWRMGGPSWLTDQGLINVLNPTEGHLGRALSGEPSYYGDAPLSVPQALARGVGVNIYPTDPVTSRQRNLARMSWQVEDVKRAAYGALRNQGLSKEQRASLRKSYAAEINKLMKEKQRYAEESQVHPRLR